MDISRVLRLVNERSRVMLSSFGYAYDPYGNQREKTAPNNSVRGSIGFVTPYTEDGNVTLDLRCYNGGHFVPQMETM